MAEATSILPGSDFVRGASGLSIAKQLGMLIAIAAAVAVGVGIILWMRAPDLRPITGITSPYQASQVAEILTEAQIDFSIDETSGLIQVSKDRLYEARMKLAASDSLDGRQIGYELLDKEQGFGVSQFMEVTKHRRSLEGELARSIQTINTVQAARVLLATPKSTTFLRDRRIPTASVTISLVAGQSLTGAQVRGITNLVAGAVPELLPQNVAVIDQTGKLLSGQDADATLIQSERQLAYVAKLESGLQNKIEDLLGPLVGRGRYTAQVTADVDFTWVEQTAEVYNPDLPALRSEETSSEERIENVAEGAGPAALTTTPPGTDANPGVTTPAGAAPPSRKKSQATRNFELDRTISHTRHAVGQLQRITVSVVVDDFLNVDADSGEGSLQPWTEDEIIRLTASVKNAIGFSPARGDTVSVINSKFFTPVIEEQIIEPGGIWTEAWFVDLARLGVGALVLLVLVMGVLRPMFRSLSQAGVAVGEHASAANNVPGLAAPGVSSFQDELDSLASAGSGGSALLPSGGTPYSSKVETVRGIVNENPARVAQVVKHWVSDNE